MTQAVNLAALGSPYVSTGYKNKLHNGNFSIWQRSSSASAGNTYTSADRWMMSGGGTLTCSKSSTPDSPSGNYSLVATSGGSSSYVNPSQAIEALNVYPLRGQNVTVSCYVKSVSGSFVGQMQFLLYYSNSSDGLFSGSTIASAASSLTSPSSSWVKMTATFTIPSDAVGLTLQLNQTAGQANGISWAYSDIQLEIGNTATTFETRHIGTELAMCQRYYWIPPYGITGFAYAATTGVITFVPPVTMRTTPSLTYRSGSSSNIDFIGGTTTGQPVGNAYTTGSAYCTTVNSMTGRTTWQGLIYSDTNLQLSADL
jgi:hypothetical protein